MAARAGRAVETAEGPSGPGAGGRRRLPRGEREASIVLAAAELFAARGFAVGTRALAAELGVTQALLYRYFPSKQALVEQVFEHMFGRLGGRARPELLADRGRPLEERLVDFYRDYVEGSSPVRMRLFVRASLEGLELARRYGGPLTASVLAPVVAELRAEAGLPDLAHIPLLRGEREIAMALHGGLMFLQIRRHVYAMPMPDAPGELIRLQVRIYLPGAIEELRRLHREPGRDSLKVRQLARERRGDGA